MLALYSKKIRGKILVGLMGLVILFTTLFPLFFPKMIFGHEIREPLFFSFSGAAWALFSSLILRSFYFRDDLIRTYKCSGTRNVGDFNEFQGELLHHFGEPGNFDGKEVWIHRKESRECGRPAKIADATIWGPYSTDCTVPGHYKAVFRVWFDPGKNSRTAYKDVLLFQFDILCFRQIFDNSIGEKKEQFFLGKKFSRFCDFKLNDWTEIEVPFYSDGTGMLEYRALAFNNANPNDRPNNFQLFEHEFIFYFQWVKIYRVEEGKLF